MKVIMIGSHLRVTGGITTVVKNYMKAGIGQKVELEYFPTYFGKNHFINTLYFFMQYCRLLLSLYLFNAQYDLAHIHMSYRGSFFRKRLIINLLNKKNIPIILHMHGSQFKDFYNESSNNKKKEIRNTLNKVKVIIALGKQWEGYYRTISTVDVVSLDNAVFPKVKAEKSGEKIYISTLGVLSKRKGTYDLLEVASKLKGHIDEKYKFLIAGDGEVDKVKQKVKDLELQDMCIIPGWVSNERDIEEIYMKSIIYVLPSYNEGMPMSILEAMSYGLPVISTNVGSIASVIEEQNGFVIKPGDVKDLQNKILNLLSDKDKRIDMSNNNIDKINKNYNIYESLENIIMLYKKVIDK